MDRGPEIKVKPVEHAHAAAEGIRVRPRPNVADVQSMCGDARKYSALPF
jgi:hypothetical protein